MIAVDIRLAMLNLGVASCACVFGALGETRWCRQRRCFDGVLPRLFVKKGRVRAGTGKLCQQTLGWPFFAVSLESENVAVHGPNMGVPRAGWILLACVCEYFISGGVRYDLPNRRAFSRPPPRP